MDIDQLKNILIIKNNDFWTKEEQTANEHRTEVTELKSKFLNLIFKILFYRERSSEGILHVEDWQLSMEQCQILSPLAGGRGLPSHAR